MPLPWKKTKVTKISQIVANLQSPKHGRLLVVKNGFPTSLIDLFINNRDCLKMPSMKNKKKSKKRNNSILVQWRHVVVEEFVGGSFLFLVLLKNFAMVVLALSTKKLAVGITLLAFLLFCLEYLGNFEIYDPKGLNFNSTEELVDGFESNSIIKEIEILEPNIYIDEEHYSCEKTNVIEEGEILVEKNKSSKKGKIRAKLIKNFVPKTLQSFEEKQKV
ncbi:hypothetical protein UlMin_028254 [Ulmus minor]